MQGYSPGLRAELTEGSSWCEVHHVSGCEAVFSPAVNLVIWRRQPDPDLMTLVDRGMPALGSWREVLPMGAGDRMQPTANVDRLPAPWRREIALLGELLCMLAGGSALGLRLEVAVKATCPRFHFDRTSLRLVCTYRGQGTQWVDERDVDRPAPGGGHPQGPWPDLVLAGASIHGAGTGDVVLLKGDRWPGNTGRGAVHRSPPVPAGSSRLLLTLDVL